MYVLILIVLSCAKLWAILVPKLYLIDIQYFIYNNQQKPNAACKIFVQKMSNYFTVRENVWKQFVALVWNMNYDPLWLMPKY